MFEFLKEAIKSIKEYEKSIHELKALIEPEKFEASNNLVKKGLKYYKQKFTENTSQYQGDHIYVRLFNDLICKGYNINQSYELSLKVIDREFAIVQLYNRFGKTYTPYFKY